MYSPTNIYTSISTLVFLCVAASVVNADHRVARLHLQQSVDRLHCSSQEFDEVVAGCSAPTYLQRLVCNFAEASCQLEDSVECNAPLEKICADYECVFDSLARVDRAYCHFRRHHYDPQAAAAWRCVRTDFEHVSQAVGHLRYAQRTLERHDSHHHHHQTRHPGYMSPAIDLHNQSHNRSTGALFIVLEGLFR